MAQTQLFASLRFNDKKCVEAMNFYKNALGGELEFMYAKDSPMATEFPPEGQDLVMHSTLKNGSWTLVGSDMMRDKAVQGDAVGIMMECESEEFARSAFAKLSEGGEVFMPLEDMFWGALYGMVTDKYGVEWSLNFTKPKA